MLRVQTRRRRLDWETARPWRRRCHVVGSKLTRSGRIIAFNGSLRCAHTQRDFVSENVHFEAEEALRC